MTVTSRRNTLLGLGAATAGLVGASSLIGGSALAHNTSRRHRHSTPAVNTRALIEAALNAPTRPAADKARDAARHPAATLEFWGLRPGMTVVEIGPGGGYWTEILAAFLAANGGALVCTFGDPERMNEQRRNGMNTFMQRFAAPAYRGVVGAGVFDSGSAKPIIEGGGADLVISSRNFHGFYLQNIKDYALRQIHGSLKSGGLVGIEQHRGDPRRRNDPSTGYIRQDVVVSDMLGAGFQFGAASEINANPNDTKDHPFGVWTLPPVARTSPQGQPADPTFDRTRYDAIGESDRMTLRFIKP
jgi:predicted methyltransferase